MEIIKTITLAATLMTAPLCVTTAQTTSSKTQTNPSTAPAAAATTQPSAAADPDTRFAVDLLKVGTEAPDFALSTLDGKTVKLSDMRGKYVVLDFWASWCPDCRRDLPSVGALHKTYSARGVEFVGVSFDDKKENLVKAEADTLPPPRNDYHWAVFLRMLRKAMRYRITVKNHHWKRLPPFGSVLRGSRRMVGDFYISSCEVRRMYDFSSRAERPDCSTWNKC